MLVISHLENNNLSHKLLFTTWVIKGVITDSVKIVFMLRMMVSCTFRMYFIITFYVEKCTEDPIIQCLSTRERPQVWRHHVPNRIGEKQKVSLVFVVSILENFWNLHTHDRMNVLILKSAKFSTSAGVTVTSPYCLQSTSGQYCSHLRWHTTMVHAVEFTACLCDKTNADYAKYMPKVLLSELRGKFLKQFLQTMS